MLGALPQANAAKLTGLEFFPQLISKPFHDGLVIVFWLAIAMALVGAAASLVRARKSSVDAQAAALESPAVEQTGAFVAHEAEVQAELVDAQPLAPATGIPEPLDEGASTS